MHLAHSSDTTLLKGQPRDQPVRGAGYEPPRVPLCWPPGEPIGLKLYIHIYITYYPSLGFEIAVLGRGREHS
jgi:hypothetical protein